MSLFKMLRGTSSRIGTEQTPFQDGNVYVTTDDNKLYCDVQDTDGTQRRICLTPGNVHVQSGTVVNLANGPLMPSGTYANLVSATGDTESDVQVDAVPAIASPAQYAVDVTARFTSGFSTAMTLVELMGDDAWGVKGTGSWAPRSDDKFYDEEDNWVDGRGYRLDENGERMMYDEQDLVINGNNLGSFTQSTTLQSLMDTVNANAAAGVKISYDAASHELAVATAQPGEGQSIQFGTGLAFNLFAISEGTRFNVLLDEDILPDLQKVKIVTTANGAAIESDSTGFNGYTTLSGFMRIYNRGSKSGYQMEQDSSSGAYVAYKTVNSSTSYLDLSNIALSTESGKTITFDQIFRSHYQAGTNASIIATVDGSQSTITNTSNTFTLGGLSVTVKGTFNTDASGNVVNAADAVSFVPSTVPHIELTLANADDKVYIDVGSLVEHVTSASQSGDAVVIDIDDNHQVTATLMDGAITLAKLDNDVQVAIGKAHSHSNSTELDLIATGDKSKWDTAASTASANATAITGIKDGSSIDSFGDVETALAGKQATLTFDSEPTENSTNPVTSGGVQTALNGKQDKMVYFGMGVRSKGILSVETDLDFTLRDGVALVALLRGTQGVANYNGSIKISSNTSITGIVVNSGTGVNLSPSISLAVGSSIVLVCRQVKDGFEWQIADGGATQNINFLYEWADAMQQRVEALESDSDFYLLRIGYDEDAGEDILVAECELDEDGNPVLDEDDYVVPLSHNALGSATNPGRGRVGYGEVVKMLYTGKRVVCIYDYDGDFAETDGVWDEDFTLEDANCITDRITATKSCDRHEEICIDFGGSAVKYKPLYTGAFYLWADDDGEEGVTGCDDGTLHKEEYFDESDRSVPGQLQKLLKTAGATIVGGDEPEDWTANDEWLEEVE